MTVSTVHFLHGINVGATSAFFSQLEDATPAPVTNLLLGMASGLPQPLFRGVLGIKPEVPFRTTQLATLLGLAGLSGADLSAGNTDLYYRQATNLGSRVSGSSTVHTRLRMAKAFLHWSTITARHQKEATAECKLTALYDGSNAPLVAVGNSAIAGTPTAAEFFALGPVSINSAALDGVQEATIDLGLSFVIKGDASEPYDRFLCIAAVNPVITLRGMSLAPWASYGPIGAQVTSWSVYLRKVNADAASGVPYVADGTAQHIKFSGTTGLACIDNSGGGGSGESTAGLKIYCRAANSAADAISISAASAIT